MYIQNDEYVIPNAMAMMFNTKIGCLLSSGVEKKKRARSIISKTEPMQDEIIKKVNPSRMRLRSEEMDGSEVDDIRPHTVVSESQLVLR